MTKGAKVGLGCLGSLVVMFVLIMAVAISSRKTPAEKANNAGPGAIVACRNAVREKLKAPATAEFQSGLEAQARQTGDGQYTVSSYVDAQNPFGAKIRTKFVCIAETTDGEKFSIVSVQTY